MSEESLDQQFEHAINELRDYLSDIIPPLVVADSIESLMTYSPDVVAANINSWVAGQFRPATGVPKSDYFFHALKKIHITGEYKLVPQKELKAFLHKMKPYILSYCPAGEREVLAHSMDRMDEGGTPVSSPVEVVYRQTGGDVKGSQAVSGVSHDSEASRIGHLLERIRKDMELITRSGGSVPEEKQEEVLSQVLAQTARSARASIELDEALQFIKRLGIQAGTEDVFRALGRNLPEWSLAPKPDVQMPEDSNLKAMHRIVTEVKDPKESATRFHHLVRAAVERLNEGHLQSAVNMIELAQKIIALKEVDHNVIENLRRRGHEDVDLDRLRKYSEATDQYPLIKKVLDFFDALSPNGLLEMLRVEPKRDRRRLFLSLLEAHGEATRTVVFQMLKSPFSPSQGMEETYLRRNLLYLLRRTPQPPSESQSELIAIISEHADIDHPMIVVKEAVMCLGQIKHREAEDALSGLLSETESRLTATKNPDDLQKYSGLLDRIAASFARIGTPSSRRILLDHALSKKGKWGDTVNRLSELAGQDLSSDTATVHRLLAAMHAAFPKKVLGFVVQQKDDDLKCIVEALVATNTPEVRHALEDLRKRFPDSMAAQASLHKPVVHQEASIAPIPSVAAVPEQKPAPAAAPAPTSSLTGDLDLFGLPGLLQSFGDHSLTGTLNLKTPQGDVFATAEFFQGRLVSCNHGNLSGEIGLYQLLEQPQSGTFQFSRNSVAEGNSSKEVLPLLMEGIRRYDELKQLQAILPDHARVVAGGAKPTASPEERDGMLFRDLWNAISKGGTPKECEAKIATDSYRIRRLLVHWLETGALVNQS